MMKNLEGIKFLAKDEMKLIEGGDAHLDMSDYYRNKSNCMLTARRLVSTGRVTGMTQKQVAQEIFAHAVAYYSAPTLEEIPGIGESIKDYLVDHAEVVDIANGGDTTLRRMAYSAIWTFMDDEF